MKFKADDLIPIPPPRFKVRGARTPLGRFAEKLQPGQSYLCKNERELECVRYAIEKRGLRTIRRVEFDENFKKVGTRLFVVEKGYNGHEKR